MTAYADFAAWRQAFRSNPSECLDRLLRQADSISPLERGRPADMAMRALAGADAAEADWADQALSEWLESRHADDDNAVARRGANAYFTYLSEGLTLAAWRPMPKTGALLRGRYRQWRDWARRRSLGEGSGDLEVVLATALAHNQTDASLRRFWLETCEQAGRRRRPEVADLWFGIALQGLRRMVRPGNGPVPAADLVEALALWAQRLDGSADDRERFSLQWRAMLSAHPRKPETWAGEVSRLLPRFALRPFAEWWAEELGLSRAERGQKLTPKDTKSILEQLDQAGDEAVAEAIVAPFYRKHLAYALASSDWHDYPKALHRAGTKLLKQAWPRLAARLARLILDRCPTNGPSWILLAEALEAQGLIDPAESVLWDACRLLPNDAHCRTELADLVARQGAERRGEAEALLRQAVKDFSQDAICYNSLAHLLAEGQDPEQIEAENLYRKALELKPGHSHALLGLGLLLVRRRRMDDVPKLIAALDGAGRSEARTLKAHYDNAMKGRSYKPFHKSNSVRPVAVAGSEWEATLAVGEALRAQFLWSDALDQVSLRFVNDNIRGELRAKAKALLAEALRRAPHHPVVAMIARRHDGHAEGPVDEAQLMVGGDFCRRLELTRVARRGDALDWMAEDFPEPAARVMIDLARLEQDAYDDDALRRIQQWLAHPADGTPVLHYAHTELTRLLPEFACRGLDEFFEAWEMSISAEELSALLDVLQLAYALPSLPLAADEPMLDFLEAA